MRRLFIGALALIAAFYLTFVVLGGLVPGPLADIEDQPTTVEVLLVGGPIHYDFLIPLDNTAHARLGWLQNAGVAMDHPEARWLVIGWGAAGFYTTTGAYSDVRLSAVWRGLTGDASVMRVDLAGTVAGRIDSLSVLLSTAQYAALLDAIEGSFANGSATAPLDIDGLTEFDHFFAAKGRFSIANTCNVWIGQTLRAAGVRFGAWTPLPQTVRMAHWRFVD